MANVTAASIKYSTALTAKVGDLLFTATRIEFSTTAEEYVEGGVELKPKSLGLTDEAISGAQSVAREAAVGETASTTALPGLIWSSGFLVTAADENEAGEELDAAKNWPCYVSLVKGVPYLRVMALAAAGQEKGYSELKVKTAIGEATTTIFALGK